MIAASLALSARLFGAAQLEPPSTEPSEVRQHIQRGVDLYDNARDFEGAARELERAYALMPDPLLDRNGRSSVLGLLRAVLYDLYEQTDDPGHLVRLRHHLRRHITELRAALGPDAEPDALVGAEQALTKVEVRLAAASAAAAVKDASPAIAAAPPDGPTTGAPAPAPVMAPPLHPLAAPEEPRTRHTRVAGAALLGASAAPLLAAAVAAAVYADRYNQIDRLDQEIDHNARPVTDEDFARVRDLERQGRVAGITAITTVALGGVLLVTGAALRVIGRKRSPSRLRATAQLGPQAWSLGVRGSF